MFKDQTIACIIPARGGSKRLPGKNIKPMLGKPLLAYAIEAAKGSKYIDHVAVSTDDEGIAQAARALGVDVVMRPAELATDEAPVAPAIAHALKAVGEMPVFVLIQPTVPGVLSSDVDAAIEKRAESGARSCITVCDIVDRPEFMYRMSDHGILSAYATPDTGRTQDMEPLCRVNGAVYVSESAVLLNEGRIIDQASLAAVAMPRERSTDIDTQFDFEVAEAALKNFSQGR